MSYLTRRLRKGTRNGLPNKLDFKTVDTYISTLDHLETEWTRKEVDQFILAVEK
jgi:hypothetical protein